MHETRLRCGFVIVSLGVGTRVRERANYKPTNFGMEGR